MVAANFLFVGPAMVGIPVVADIRLAGGAASYGTIVDACVGSNLLSIGLSSRLLQVLRRGLRLSWWG
jgi:hypothetical protein